jgi:hypothetical protein
MKYVTYIFLYLLPPNQTLTNMKDKLTIRVLIIINVLALNICALYGQPDNKIKACYHNMTVAETSGGKWIWGQSVSLGDTLAIALEGNINNYDIPWCASFGCCDSLSYNGMSISLHTIIADTSYRILITGGLTGGGYFTDGFVEIPSGWGVDSVHNMSNNPGTGAYDTLVDHKIIFHTGTDYSGCVCSDCGRAHLNYYISKRIIVPTRITSETNDLSILYPNPARDKITIETRTSNVYDNMTVFIYNNQGQLIMQQPIQKARTEIDISNLDRGVYMVRVSGHAIQGVKKIIKE